MLTGVESRTSSPVRITRDAESLQSLNVRGLYPCGEGAGYAGGILSAGVDGIKVAEAVARESGMKFEDIKKLHQKKFREELGLFLSKANIWCRSSRRRRRTTRACAPSEIYVTRDYAHWSSPLPMHVDQVKQMAQISETRSPQGIAAVVPLVPGARAAPGERAIYLHEIQDPGNLGTILRTLAWFGNFRCLLSPDSVDVHNGKVVRASMGAIFHVPVEIDVPLTRCRTFRTHRVAWISLGRRSRRRRFGTSTATCSATKRAACRASSWRALNAQAIHDRRERAPSNR